MKITREDFISTLQTASEELHTAVCKLSDLDDSLDIIEEYVKNDEELSEDIVDRLQYTKGLRKILTQMLEEEGMSMVFEDIAEELEDENDDNN